MPRRQRQEWIYTCGHCGTSSQDMLHLATADLHEEATMLHGPGWALALYEDEWFCSPSCFLTWLEAQILAAVVGGIAEQEDLMDCDVDETDFTDREDKFYEWPQPN